MNFVLRVLTSLLSNLHRSCGQKSTPRFCPQSKQKSRSYSFEPMNRDKRHFVHECCEHFGCQSEAYDPEPKRNVVATAVRDKVWLPSMSLLEVIQRENGVRKIPKPVINFSNSSTVLPVPVTANMAWR